jgi:hypothetical protein
MKNGDFKDDVMFCEEIKLVSIWDVKYFNVIVNFLLFEFKHVSLSP